MLSFVAGIIGIIIIIGVNVWVDWCIENGGRNGFLFFMIPIVFITSAAGSFFVSYINK